MGSHLCPSHPAPKMELFQRSVQEKKKEIHEVCLALFSLPPASSSHFNLSQDIEKAHWKYSWVGDIVYSGLVHMRFDWVKRFLQ